MRQPGRKNVFYFGTYRCRKQALPARRLSRVWESPHTIVIRRQTPALFGTGDVYDTLAHVTHIVMSNIVLLAIARQGFELDARDRVGDVRHVFGRHVMVRNSLGRERTPKRTVREFQALKSLWRGYLVGDVAVDVDQRGTVIKCTHTVRIPKLVIEGFCRHFGVVFAVRDDDSNTCSVSPGAELRYTRGSECHPSGSRVAVAKRNFQEARRDKKTSTRTITLPAYRRCLR